MAAAPPGGAAGLGGGVVPAPFTASFATLFNDASTDPTDGDINIQQAPFVVNLVDQTDNVDSTTLKNRLAASGESDELMGVTISSGGKSRGHTSAHFVMAAPSTTSPIKICSSGSRGKWSGTIPSCRSSRQTFFTSPPTLSWWQRSPRSWPP